jgi:hypothetical protein
MHGPAAPGTMPPPPRQSRRHRHARRFLQRPHSMNRREVAIGGRGRGADQRRDDKVPGCRRKSWAHRAHQARRAGLLLRIASSSMAQSSVAHAGATMPFRYENGSIESKRARGAWPTELKVRNNVTRPQPCELRSVAPQSPRTSDAPDRAVQSYHCLHAHAQRETPPIWSTPRKRLCSATPCVRRRAYGLGPRVP